MAYVLPIEILIENNHIENDLTQNQITLRIFINNYYLSIALGYG